MSHIRLQISTVLLLSAFSLDGQLIDINRQTQGVLVPERGGTGQGTWIPGRCVQVGADGRLESASAPCSTVSGSDFVVGGSNLSTPDALVRVLASGTVGQAGNLFYESAGLRIVNSSGSQSTISLHDSSGPKWNFGRDTDNSFFIFDHSLSSANRVLALSGGNLGIGPGSPPESTLTLHDNKPSVIGPITFQGSGPNDLSVSGTYSGTQTRTMCVEIDGTGSPDTFRWGEDNCATWVQTGVQITGGEQTIWYDLVLQFQNTTGHALGDRWTWQVTPGGITHLSVRAGVANFQSAPYRDEPILSITRPTGNDTLLFQVTSAGSVRVGQNGIRMWAPGGGSNWLGEITANTDTLLPVISGGVLFPQRNNDSQSIYGFVENCYNVGPCSYPRTVMGMVGRAPGLLSFERITEGQTSAVPGFYMDLSNLRLSAGGTGSAYPAWQRSGVRWHATLADGSVLTQIKAAPPQEHDDVVVYSGIAPPSAGCAEFNTEGKLTSTGLACGTGGGGSGSGTPNQQYGFTNQTSLTVLGSQHGFGHNRILADCYDTTVSPAARFFPSMTINTSTYDVTFTFAEPKTGYCVLNGWGGTTTSSTAWQVHFKVWGTGTDFVLQDTDDELSIWRHELGGSTVTISKVVCESDAGSPTIMLQRDDGTPADMFPSALTCGTTPGEQTTFVSGENVLTAGQLIDLLIVSAGGTAKWIAVTVSGTTGQ